MNLIELKNVSFKYDKPLFENLNLIIKDNSLMIIIAPNNKGKTTLLKIISGDIYVKNIYFKGNKVNNTNILKDNVSLVSNNEIYYSKTVYDELELYTSNKNNILYLLDYFDLKMYKDISPNNLSKEDKIILNIIIALIKKPNLILLDNILVNISIQKKNIIISKLKKYSQNNSISIILASSQIDDSIYFDELLFIENNNVSTNLKSKRVKLPFTYELSEKLLIYNLISEEEYDMKKLVDKLC